MGLSLMENFSIFTDSNLKVGSQISKDAKTQPKSTSSDFGFLVAPARHSGQFPVN